MNHIGSAISRRLNPIRRSHVLVVCCQRYDQVDRQPIRWRSTCSSSYKQVDGQPIRWRSTCSSSYKQCHRSFGQEGFVRCFHTDSPTLSTGRVQTKEMGAAPPSKSRWGLPNNNDDQGDGEKVKEFSEIPGPKPWPVLGNLAQLMMRKDYDPTQIHKMWRNLFDEYGPIVKISNPTKRPFIATINPDDLEIIYKTTSDDPIRRSLGILKKVRDNAPNNYFQKKSGVLPENGEEWWRLRSRVQAPLLRPKNVSAYLPKVDRATLAYMDRIELLQKETGCVPDNFLEDIYRWALECVGYVALDRELGGLEPDLPEDSPPIKMVRHINEIFSAMNGAEMSYSTWRLYKTKNYTRLEKAHNAFLDIADQTIQDASRSLEEAKAKGDPNRTLSIMETFLNTEGLSKSDVATMVLDMMLAGVDTTSHTVGFALYLLAMNPEAQQKLQQEVDSVLGDSKELLPDHLTEMLYLNYVVKETLRLHPVLLGNSRVLTQDVVLSGYKVPAGCMAMAFNILICRDEKNFPRPNDFLPERWARDRPYGPIHPYASLPFSHGKRICIGKRIAEQELYTFLIRAMQRYTVTFESNQPMELRTQLTMKPMIPLKFKFHSRK